MQQLAIFGVAMLTSKGASGMQGASLIALVGTLVVVPTIPVAGMVLILGIDRCMSKVRALVNMISNGVATIVMARREPELDQSKMDVLRRLDNTYPNKRRSMNTKPIIAASLALCTSYACAQSQSVQIYGRLNLGLEEVNTSADAKGQNVSTARLSNNRSVLGFRGSEDLGDGMQAIFQIEGTLSPNTGAGSPAQRDTRVGLEGSAGTLFLGHWTTPYNNSTAGLDPFYPTTAGYMSIMGNGSASSTDNVTDTSSFDRRQQNTVNYWTPDWSGFSVRTMQGLNEERPASGAKPSLTSVAAIYEQGPWYLVATQERHHEYQGKGLNDTGNKLAASYRFTDTRVSLIGERLKYEAPTGTLERNAWYLSLSQQFGRHGLRFGIARAGDGTGSAPATQRIGFIRKGPDTGATHYTLGYDYTFSKRTSVFAYFTHLHNEKNGVYDFAINSVTVSPGAAARGTVLGMRHNF